MKRSARTRTSEEVCTDPDLGLVAQIMFGSRPGSNDRTRTFRAFAGHSFSAKKKLFVVALILCSWHSRAPEINPIDLIFLGIFEAGPSLKQFEITPNNLASDIFVPFLKLQITSCFRASLNNSFKDCWRLCIKRNVLMTRQSGQIVNRSGFIRAGIKGSRAQVGYG
jgi:hypothetical protein